MSPLDSQQIETQLREHLPEGAITASDHEVRQPWIEIAPEALFQACTHLHQSEGLFFDLLECLSGVDQGTKAGTLQTVYHLYSIPYGHRIVLKCTVPRNTPDQPLPSMPSVSSIWPTANWHERESFDLVGIHYEGHPDLRRILMPEDWVGHPLRKDYENPEFYHGIKTAY